MESNSSIDGQFESETIESVANFLGKVARWCVGEDSILFRGHQDTAWSLVPRLGRIKSRYRFLELVPDIEKKLLEDFKCLAVPYIGSRQLSQWDLLALAQHHGLPTRLLDWSSNPLVALWFAVEKPSESKSPAAVWAYRASECDFVDQDGVDFTGIPRTLIFRPRHHDNRIISQAGWFSVHYYLDEAKRFSGFERIREQKSKLKKFVVPAEYFPEIREDLSRCGITKASLFPDLAGLCGHLNWKYECLPDEVDYDQKEG